MATLSVGQQGGAVLGLARRLVGLLSPWPWLAALAPPPHRTRDPDVAVTLVAALALARPQETAACPGH